MNIIRYYKFLKYFYLNNWRMNNKAENIMYITNQIIDIFILPIIIIYMLYNYGNFNSIIWINLILFPLYFYFGGLYETRKNINNSPICQTLSLIGFRSKEIFTIIDISTNLWLYLSRFIILLMLYIYSVFILRFSFLLVTLFLLFSLVGLWLRKYSDFIPEFLLMIANYIFDYQFVSIFIFIIKSLNYKKISVLFIFLLVFYLTLFLFIKLLKLSNKGGKFIREWRIAFIEGGVPLPSFLFLNSLFPCITLFIMYVITTNQQLSIYSVEKIIAVKIIVLFLGVTSTYSIPLYAFDLEKMRMFQLKNLGNFIQHKIKYKILIAYFLHAIIYFSYSAIYLLIIPDKLYIKFIILLISFIPVCVLIPLIYLLLTIIFPIFNRQYIIGYNQPSRFVLIGSYISSTLLMALTALWGVYIVINHHLLLTSIFILCTFAGIFLISLLLLYKIYHKYEQFIEIGRTHVEDEKFYV